jgi:acyl-CoA thioester hydrolase
MLYRLTHRVSHADVDFLGELKVPSLLGLLEQAAVEASTACGYDAARYTREQRVWIIRRTRLERLIPVGGVDELQVETQVTDVRRARSLRHYRVCRGEQVVTTASTDWVYCDMMSGKPVRIPAELQRALSSGVELPSLARAAALPADPPHAPVELSLTVRPSHLDHVVHVNNGIYAAFLEDGAFTLFAQHGWSLERMLDTGGALRLRWLDAEYLSDAQNGDELIVRSWILGSDTASGASGSTGWGLGSLDKRLQPVALLQSIVEREGRELLRAHSEWVWRRRPQVLGGVPEPV